MNTTWMRRVLLVLPAVALSGALAHPLPAPGGHAREIAGYFQALAFLNDPLRSFTYLTPEESLSALHLHSILSTPIIALGFPQGGRLVSLFGALVAVILLSILGQRLTGDDRVALLAPALLWIHPLFQLFASRMWPETLSITLTVGALVAYAAHTTADHRRWLAVSYATFALAITTHLWELTILLPLVAWSLWRRDWFAATGYLLVGGATVAVVEAVKHLQPNPGSFMARVVWRNPELLTSPDWWIRSSLHPVAVSITVTLPLAILAAGGCAYWAYRTRRTHPVVLSSWLAAGASIALLLPAGYNHVYYNWNLLAPLAILGAIGLARALDALKPVLDDRHIRFAPNVVAVFLTLTAVTYGAVFVVELGPNLVDNAVGDDISRLDAAGGVADGEAVAAGRQIQQASVENASEIVFVGEWGQNSGLEYFGRPTPPYYRTPVLSRVLIYSDVLVREHAINQSNAEGPRFTSASQSVQECSVKVVRANETIDVQRCS